MSYTAQTTTISLSKEDLRMLETVREIVNESNSYIFKRALSCYYNHLKNELNENK